MIFLLWGANMAQASINDPLSAATRTLKKQLLVTAVGTITFKAFDVTIEHIPIAGLSIQFNRGVFEFLMFITLAYLIPVFALYYYIDIKNFPVTFHQNSVEQSATRKLDEFSTKVAFEIFNAILRVLPSNLSTSERHEPRIGAYLKSLSRAKPFNEQEFAKSLGLRRKGNVGPELRYESDLEILRPMLAVASPIARRFTRRRVWNIVRVTAWRFGVRAAYFIRNYGVDGLLPLALGALAMAALFGLDVTVLTHWTPKD
jgi:hypothetical protein